MPKVFTSKTQKLGEIGEHLAVRYFEQRGYKIIERNYTKKWGEIDIVCEKGTVTHFVEVKSKIEKVVYQGSIDRYRAEDAMHPWKLKRIARTIETYILEKDLKGEWQMDLAVVHISEDFKEARVEVVENVLN